MLRSINVPSLVNSLWVTNFGSSGPLSEIAEISGCVGDDGASPVPFSTRLSLSAMSTREPHLVSRQSPHLIGGNARLMKHSEVLVSEIPAGARALQNLRETTKTWLADDPDPTLRQGIKD